MIYWEENSSRKVTYFTVSFLCFPTFSWEPNRLNKKKQIINEYLKEFDKMEWQRNRVNREETIIKDFVLLCND
jgi:hypothetical protein